MHREARAHELSIRRGFTRKNAPDAVVITFRPLRAPHRRCRVLVLLHIATQFTPVGAPDIAGLLLHGMPSTPRYWIGSSNGHEFRMTMALICAPRPHPIRQPIKPRLTRPGADDGTDWKFSSTPVASAESRRARQLCGLSPTNRSTRRRNAHRPPSGSRAVRMRRRDCRQRSPGWRLTSRRGGEIDRFTSYCVRDLDDAVLEVSQFARRNPAIFSSSLWRRVLAARS